MFGRLHVLPIVERLLRAYPDLSVKMTMSDRSVHLIDEEIDVAVRIGALVDSTMQAVKVGEVRRVVVASPAYLSGPSPASAPIPVNVIDPPRRFGSANVSAFTRMARDYFRATPIPCDPQDQLPH